MVQSQSGSGMEASCLEIEGFQQPRSRQEHLHDRQGYEPIAPAHDRRHDDPQARAETQHNYVQRVKDFAAFLSRSPATASKEDVRRYQLHLASNGARTPKINGCPYRKSNPDILMVQASEKRFGNDAANSLDSACNRRILVQR